MQYHHTKNKLGRIYESHKQFSNSKSFKEKYVLKTSPPEDSQKIKQKEDSH
jgi:hypothetical protein